MHLFVIELLEIRCDYVFRSPYQGKSEALLLPVGEVFDLFVHDKVFLLERDLGLRYPVFRMNSASTPI